MISPAASPPRLTTLIVLSALSVLPVNMFLPSLSNIAASFQADYGLVNLSVAGYAGVSAALQLIMGPLSDRFGRRPIALLGLAIFIAASLGCALATDIWSFLAFRLVQAAAITGYVVSLAVIRDTSGERQTASIIGYVATAWAVAPMLGPMLGGALDALFGWRASFWAFILFGLVVLAWCWVDLSETNTARSTSILKQLGTYPELFRSRRFWAYSLCMAFATGTFYVFLGGAPLAAASVFDISPTRLGVYMGSTTLGYILGSYLSGRYASRFPLTATVVAGRLVASAGVAAGIVLFAAGARSPLVFFGTYIMISAGNGATTAAASAGVLSVRPHLAGSASGLSGALTIAGAAIMSSLSGAILTPENVVYALFAIALAASLAGLCAALYVVALDRREGPAGTAPQH